MRTVALGTAVLAYGPKLIRYGSLGGAFLPKTGPASLRFGMNQNWLFGGKFNPDALSPQFDDSGFSKVTLPHCVTELSWDNWNPDTWEHLWIYRRHFDLPPGSKGKRVFLNFEGVMVGTTPVVNGHAFPQHLGGYLPSRYEITDEVTDTGNILAVQVDSRWSNVPPEGSPGGPASIDYLEPGGIIRDVYMQAVPQIFIEDVFAKPVNVLDASRRIEVNCTINAAGAVPKNVELQVELRNRSKVVAGTREKVKIESEGKSEIKLVLSKLGNIKLWSPNEPYLYDVVATLIVNGEPVHDYLVRTGLRDARFELDGFFLNGSRLQIFGLNRHELFPYVGFAMPARVMRHDAIMIRDEFNCNMVRCSHYPQSEAFLDVCDELGLMVWEEVPGWGYVGNELWQEHLLKDVREMVIRDRNHPSIIIWGTRPNEAPNHVDLYKKTRAIAKALDNSRQSSGTMTTTSETGWSEDVFAYDDYVSEPDGSPKIADSPPGVPYLITEAVGQRDYKYQNEGMNAKYRRAGAVWLQEEQAIWHAQAHSRAGGNPRISGLIGWCAYDYGSLLNAYNGVKCPGVADFFRIPKLGASFYRSQVSPEVRPVIGPNFYWDFGARTPFGPGKHVAIFSNCDTLQLFVDGNHHSTLHPDTMGFPNLNFPPFFADLEIKGTNHPELKIEGYAGDKLVMSQTYSSDPSQDKFIFQADDEELIGDGTDATRLVFKVVDKYGTPRLLAGGEITFKLTGPGEMVGVNPFQLAETGGVGAIWVKGTPNSSGQIRVEATHSLYGTNSLTINLKRGQTEGKV